MSGVYLTKYFLTIMKRRKDMETDDDDETSREI